MLVLMIIVFVLDSRQLSNYISYGQWLANLITLLYFIWMYQRASLRIKRTMKYAVAVAIVGEIFLCLVLGMYEYRLENIPIYVPLGHAILYTTIWYLTHDPLIVKYSDKLIPFLFAASLIYSVILYMQDDDTYGLICTGILLIILMIHPKSQRFFLLMFFAVAYLEQFGTFFECWYWHPTLLNRTDWISSGNPPSGISVFYFGLDILCLGVYLFRNPKTNKRWRKSSIKTT